MTDRLDARQREVLGAVIVNYVVARTPVGSRTVSKARADGLSPATIRNTMAELEEMGYLLQPHTSAGRIPTDLGYRYYVDSMMSGKPLTAVESRAIRSALPGADEHPRVEELLQRTVKLLADLSLQVGVVLAPRFTSAILRRLDFHRLPDGRILAVFVSESGIVDHKLITSSVPLSDTELVTISNMVNQNFHGKTLPRIRAELIDQMRREKALYDRLLSEALRLCRSYLDERADDDDEVIVGGTSNVVGEEGFADVDGMRALFRAFEDKNRLVHLLNACLGEDRTQIRIGSECHDPMFSAVTVISSPYRYRDRAVGALGIVGPRRMPYDRLVTLVDSLSTFLSDALALRNGVTSTKGASHGG
ncbi:MAG: heat-inducible transcriptional repressor HrcA [Acidobacteriota bacterium]